MDEDSGQVAFGWTPRRKQVRALLADVHADAADLYSLAIDHLCVQPMTWPRLMVVSHCVRELVPTIVEAQSLPKPNRADDSKATKALAASWRRSNLPLEPDQSEYGMADETLRPVPQAVYVDARAVALAGGAATQNSRIVTSLLATGQDADINSAPLRRLHDAIEDFRGWAHHQDHSQPPKPLPQMEKVQAALEVLDEALMTRFANRGDRVVALREMLAKANWRAEGGNDA